ncbi:MAG: PP2C family protein-serine/threonine phosphatase, partial [Ignavibacteriae bacterium]|nr:PP2C family protein-serine/threonine phosphatase [Ignavibacteriota bacterium]
PPMLLRNSGTELICLDKSGIFAGAVDDFKYEKHEILLKEGDLLFLYTDGVTETFNSSEEQFGEERLLSVLKDGINKSPREICESALISVKTWIGNETQADDITIVALKVK